MKKIKANSRQIIPAHPLDNPAFSNRRLGDVKSIASRQEKANGISTCWPMYSIAIRKTKQIRGLTSFAKMIEVEELRKMPML